MNRRRFITLSSASAALSALGPSCLNRSRGSAALVDTPDKRQAYLADLLKRICVDIGPHSIFEPAYDQVAALVKAEMEKGLPEVGYSRSTFTGWRLLSEPIFLLDGNRIEAYACHGSPGTPDGGISGRLVRIEHKNPDKVFYAVEGKEEARAYIVVNDNGGAVPLPSYMNPLEAQLQDGDSTFDKQGRWPTLCVGSQDRALLDEAAASSKSASWTVKTEFVPGMAANSVIGTIPGRTEEEILFIAHLDTVYGSPGANDNTASMITMLMIAHALSAEKPAKTLRFVASAGEEYGKIGSRHYKNERQTAGTLKNIRAIVEFDSLTWGNDFWMYSKTPALRAAVVEATVKTGIRGTPKHFEQDGSLDVKPFVESGIPALYINTRGEVYNPVRKVWHTPEDTPDRVPKELVENGFLVFSEVARGLSGC